MEPRLGIYIAGPMRGIPEWNFPAFHRVHDEWFEQDGQVRERIFWFCPACQDEQGGFRTEGMSGGEDLRDLGFDLRRALGKDLGWIAKNADVVVVLPGWENSKGAQAEVALAHALDLIVTAYDDQADGFGDDPAQAPNVIPFVPSYLTDKVRTEDLWANGNDYGYVDSSRHSVTSEDLDAHVAKDDPEPATIDSPALQGLMDHFGVNAEFVADPSLKDGEVRVTSSSGGAKGTKPARFELIPAGPLWLLAELYGKGALKYEDRNWERGYPWSLSYGAAQRHMTAFWKGEDFDAHKDDCPEDCVQHTELPHPICAVFHMFALAQFLEHNNEFDDRPIR